MGGLKSWNYTGIFRCREGQLIQYVVFACSKHRRAIGDELVDRCAIGQGNILRQFRGQKLDEQFILQLQKLRQILRLLVQAIGLGLLDQELAVDQMLQNLRHDFLFDFFVGGGWQRDTL